MESGSTRLAIIGGGPAGHTAAATAARLGAEVVVIERDVVGGAAHLWDCIPSKTLIATGGARTFANRFQEFGLDEGHASFDLPALRDRVERVAGSLNNQFTELLASQDVEVISGSAKMKGPNQAVVETNDGLREIEADAFLLATGSRPRIPDWAKPDGQRVLTTRDAYPPPEIPDHVIIIGSGVTGVEFVHLFNSFGSEVTLIVSRQQVLPSKDPEVAAALEENFLERGVHLLKGARASALDVTNDGVVLSCNDGRRIQATHALLAIGSVPNSDSLGLDAAGVEVDEHGYVPINQHCQTNVTHIYAAGDLSGKLPLSSVGAMQGRKIAQHLMGVTGRDNRDIDYDKAASAIFTEPEIAEVGLAEAEAFAMGRKVRVTKVPFSSSAKAQINCDSRGFIKIVSDPMTGVVLGGSIVGRDAAELIGTIALAVTAGLRVADISDTLFVHPTLSETIADAAE